jgi:metal-responsive CopG/Arc/MetJ family transcriptional regulator
MSSEETAETAGDPPDATDMEHVSLRLPAQLLDDVDNVWEERGFSSRSEFLRNAVRDATYPPTTLSDEAIEAIEESAEQIRNGDFVPLNDG